MITNEHALNILDGLFIDLSLLMVRVIFDAVGMTLYVRRIMMTS